MRSKTERLQDSKSLDRAVTSQRTKSERKKEETTGVQCDLGSTFFEKFDQRKCLRCGLNDKISPGQCQFHPARCVSKAGAGTYLYSSQWHKCRENCPDEQACVTEAQHYYGTHLPFTGSSRPVPTLQRVQGVKVAAEVMTDVSLLFNPFKDSSCSQASRRSRSPLDRSLRRDESQSRLEAKYLKLPKDSTDKKHHPSSPLTASQLEMDFRSPPDKHDSSILRYLERSQEQWAKVEQQIKGKYQ